MDKTSNIGLPLIQPSQAQKHVTVNEALVRLDGVAQLRLVGRDLSTPPLYAMEGAIYALGADPVGDWSGHGRELAVRSNGGWIFVAPTRGWRGWDESVRSFVMHDGSEWLPHVVALSAGGAATAHRVIEFDQDLSPGPLVVTETRIPAGAQVIGVTGRVISVITGAGLTSWRVGVSGSTNRYGSGLGLGVNSNLIGLSGSPVTYYAPTPIHIVGEGGSFASGRIRICLHLTELSPPKEF